MVDKWNTLGDSITAAQYVTPAETYGSLVCQALGLQHVNSGMSGHTADAMLARIQADVIAGGPKFCSVMAGTNEMAGAVSNNTPLKPMRDNYITKMGGIIDALAAAAIKPIVISPPLSRVVREVGRWPKILPPLRDLCDAKQAMYIPLQEAMLTDLENGTGSQFLSWFLPTPGTGDGTDLYHWGAPGNARLANLILRYAMIASTSPPPPVGPDPARVGEIFSATLASAFGNIGGATIRSRVPVSVLTIPAGAVSWMRFKLKGHAEEPLQVGRMFAGPRASGYAASSLAAVRVGGAANYTIPADVLVWSDWCPIAWNKTADLMWSLYGSGGTSADKLAAHSALGGAATAIKYGDEAAALAPSGFTEYAGYLSLVAAIETDGF